MKLRDIFLVFLRLGCTAFGGPFAHLGFFHDEFVRRRRWLTERDFADLVALCQFLPGPASSQFGFAVGWRQGGIPGAFAAWAGFTLPAATLMIGFALGLARVGDLAAAGWITGLKLAAVAVVANALLDMAGRLCPDHPRRWLALGTAGVLVAVPSSLLPVGLIGLGLLVGWLVYRHRLAAPSGGGAGGVGKGAGFRWGWLGAFGFLLLGLPVAARAWPDSPVAVGEAFYRAGALVFGGGHVVLPLLDSFIVARGWVGEEQFLAGYGAAQAMPGPLFAFSAFLGASLTTGFGGVAGGWYALGMTFLPSWLLVLGVLPAWERLRYMTGFQAALRGANAAVVGLLLAALYDPIGTTAVTTAGRLAFAAAGLGLLRYGRLPPWALVLLAGLAGQGVFGSPPGGA